MESENIQELLRIKLINSSIYKRIINLQTGEKIDYVEFQMLYQSATKLELGATIAGLLARIGVSISGD